jgi:hypothetical protein
LWLGGGDGKVIDVNAEHDEIRGAEPFEEQTLIEGGVGVAEREEI